MPDPLALIHNVEAGRARVPVHTHAEGGADGDAHPVPRIRDYVLEIVTLPGHQESGLQVHLAVLLDAGVEDGLCTFKEGGFYVLHLRPVCGQNVRPDKADGVEQKQR